MKFFKIMSKKIIDLESVKNSVLPTTGKSDDNSSEYSKSNEEFIRKCSKPLKIVRECPRCYEPCNTKLEVYNHTAKCCAEAFKCNYERCPFASLYRQHFEYHINWHKGKKDIKCDKCPYTCSTSAMLKSHLRTHEKFTRYNCADCSLSTKHPSVLKQHLNLTGHKAAPVLNKDGNRPEKETDGDFKTHIRVKKRIGECQDTNSLKVVQHDNPSKSTSPEASDDDLIEVYGSVVETNQEIRTPTSTKKRTRELESDLLLGSPTMKKLKSSSRVIELEISVDKDIPRESKSFVSTAFIMLGSSDDVNKINEAAYVSNTTSVKIEQMLSTTLLLK